MVLQVFLKMDQRTLFRNDFSNVAGLELTGTIYSDRNLATAFNLTGYTLTIRMNKEWHSSDYFNKAATIVAAASGTWKYLLVTGDMPTPGIYLVKVEVSKSGTQVSTLNRQEIYIKEGATA